MSDITLVNLYYENQAGYVPIGPLYVTAALEQENYQVDFRDFLVGSSVYSEPLNPDNILSFLDHSADIIGISCASELLPLAVLALQKLKRAYPTKTVILGGIGPAGVAQELLEQFPFIDIVVNGEGERTAVELMKRISTGKPLHDVRGIFFRQGSKVTAAPARERVRNLDELPFPAYHQVDLSHYAVTGIYSARGCPYACTFCDVSRFWKGPRSTRSISNMINEINLLTDLYHRHEIDIMDDIFVTGRAKVLAFCNQVKKQDVDFRWACCGRIDLMDEELMAEMAAAGCHLIFYGIESGSDQILQHITKGFTAAQAKDILVKSRKYVQVSVSLMWGFPFETMKDFEETLAFRDFARDIGCEVDNYLLAPLPLSPLYNEYKNSLVFAGEKCGLLTGSSQDDVMDFIRSYPQISHWYYRFPTENFTGKYDIIGNDKEGNI